MSLTMSTICRVPSVPEGGAGMNLGPAQMTAGQQKQHNCTGSSPVLPLNHSPRQVPGDPCHSSAMTLG